MKNVSILILETSVIEAIADPHYMFKAVNQFLVSSGKPPLFDVQLVAITKEVKLENSLYTVHAEKLLKDVHKTDLIFIPAISGDIPAALKLNKDYMPWIVNQYKNGAEVASLCIGAFVLAATGLAGDLFKWWSQFILESVTLFGRKIYGSRYCHPRF